MEVKVLIIVFVQVISGVNIKLLFNEVIVEFWFGQYVLIYDLFY